jgi:hypothetical protein
MFIGMHKTWMQQEEDRASKRQRVRFISNIFLRVKDEDRIALE